MKQALMANYSEDEITKIAVILEYVALDFFNRFIDVALAKWVRTTGYRLYIICYNLGTTVIPRRIESNGYAKFRWGRGKGGRGTRCIMVYMKV